MRRSTIKKIRRYITEVYRLAGPGWVLYQPAPMGITGSTLNRYWTEQENMRKDNWWGLS